MKPILRVGVVLLIVAMVIVFPWAGIWALNTLFGLGIPYTKLNWLAMLVLIALLRGEVKRETE